MKLFFYCGQATSGDFGKLLQAGVRKKHNIFSFGRQLFKVKDRMEFPAVKEGTLWGGGLDEETSILNLKPQSWRQKNIFHLKRYFERDFPYNC